MKIAICEDEKIFQDVLIKELEQYFGILNVEIDAFQSGRQFLERFEQAPEQYRIIFMDIEMPGMDGLETSRQLRMLNRRVPVIFLTSHTELAMEGYEVDAFRFLSKPIARDKLLKALRDIQRQDALEHKISLNDGQKDIILNSDVIEYVKSDNVYINIFTDTGSYLIRKKLCEMEEILLCPVFYKPHRSYILHLGKVKSYDGRRIHMRSGKEIPISRGKGNEFKNAMLEYLRILEHV